MSVFVARPQGTGVAFPGLVLALLVCLTGMNTACGTGTTKNGTITTTTNPSAPPQPSYPSTPPVPITWSPQSSPLPAPPAQVPPPAGSNDFPLSISNPTDGSTVTSPINVVASASP